MTDQALAVTTEASSGLQVFARTWNIACMLDAMHRMGAVMNRHIASEADLAPLIAACPQIQTQQISIDCHGNRVFKFILPNNIRLRERGSVAELVDASDSVCASIDFRGMCRYAT